MYILILVLDYKRLHVHILFHLRILALFHHSDVFCAALWSFSDVLISKHDGCRCGHDGPDYAGLALRHLPPGGEAGRNMQCLLVLNRSRACCIFVHVCVCVSI